VRHCYASNKSCDTFTLADSYLCHDDVDDTARLSLHVCLQGVTGFSSIKPRVGSGVGRIDPVTAYLKSNISKTVHFRENLLKNTNRKPNDNNLLNLNDL